MGIPDGVGGIAATLHVMGALTREGKKNMNVRNLALSLVKNCQQKDWDCEIARLHEYVRDEVRYVGDVNDVETVQTPQKTIELMAGDCDDKSVMLAALLESIGHPTRFTAIGFQAGVYCHVFVETKRGDIWVALETTEPVSVGWQPDRRLVIERMRFYN